MDKITYEMTKMDKWTNGQMDKWTNGQMDKWTNGQKKFRRFALKANQKINKINGSKLGRNTDTTKAEERELQTSGGLKNRFAERRLLGRVCERTASQHPAFIAPWTICCYRWSQWVNKNPWLITRFVPILNPLPNITMYIIQTERIR